MSGSSLKVRELLAALSECQGEARVEVLYDCGCAEGTVVGVEITPASDHDGDGGSVVLMVD